MEAIILVGLPGSGKTTYWHTHFGDTHSHISGDVHGPFRNQAKLMAECLRAQKSFVVDNTNVTAESRAPYIQAALSAGYRVICCYFDVPVRVAIGRNNHRSDKKPIPVPAILRMAKILKPPEPEEGFDEIRIICETETWKA